MSAEQEKPDPEFEAYKVVIDSKECDHCDKGTLWTIEGPDEVCIGISWGDEEFTDDICDLMNDAFAAGRAYSEVQEVA